MSVTFSFNRAATHTLAAILAAMILFPSVGCKSTPKLVWKDKDQQPSAMPGANKDKPQPEIRLVEGKKEKPTPRMLVDFGYVQASMNNHNEAANLFQRALKLNKKEADAYVGLAKVKMAQGHPDQAIETLEEGLKRCPKSAAIWNEIGIARSQIKQMPQAIEAIAKAHELEPDSNLYLANLGGMLVVQGDTEKAYKCFSKFMSSADAHVRIGEILGGQGRISEATAQFRAAVEAEPNHPRAGTLLAQSANPTLQQVDYKTSR
jgi:tetratricopeptide (TPR) repeat protein